MVDPKLNMAEEAEQHLKLLIDRPAEELSRSEDKLLDALAMLNGLPLTSEEFGLAANRLKAPRCRRSHGPAGVRRYARPDCSGSS